MSVEGKFDKYKKQATAVQRLAYDLAQPLMEQTTASTDLDSVYQVFERTPQQLKHNPFGGIGTITGMSSALLTRSTIGNLDSMSSHCLLKGSKLLSNLSLPFK